MGAISDFLDGAGPKDIETPKRGTISAFLDGGGPSDKFAKDYVGLPLTPDEAKQAWQEGVARGAKTVAYSLGQMVNRAVGTPETQRAFDVRMREALPPMENPPGEMRAGEFAGSMLATAPLNTMIPGGASARLLPRMFAGGVGGAMTAPLATTEADTTSPDFSKQKSYEAALGAGLGAAAPAAISGVSRAISPIRSHLTEQGKKLASFYEANVGNLTPAQATGSPVVRWVEDTWARLPGSAGPQQRIIAGQQADYNRAWLNRAGIDAEAATPEVLANARNNYFKPAFEQLRQQSVVDLGQQFDNDLTNVALKYRNRLPSDQVPIFNAKLDELRKLAQPFPGVRNSLDGEQFVNIRSPIVDQIAENRGNEALQNALRGLKKALDAAEERSMGPQVRDARKALDKQYSIFRSIEDAVAKNPEGNISPTAIEKTIAPRFKGGAWAEGRTDSKELVDAGKAFLRPLPSSGTAERQYMMQLMTGQAPPMPEGEAGILRATTGLLTAPTLQAAANTPVGRWWLRNQVASQVPGLLGSMQPVSGVTAGYLSER